MNRSTFLKSLALLPLTVAGGRMNLLGQLAALPEDAASAGSAAAPARRMPLLFLGHGSPMNAIEENAFVRGFRKVAAALPRPKAIVCVSAHWETRGTHVTAMERPRTIHDFGGFPRELYEVQYPAPGDPALARAARDTVRGAEIGLDQSWGLDHGAWSVIKHLYPAAAVPVLQLSLDTARSPRQHYELAKELTFLRERGVLVVGSGNIVHNLGRVAWDRLDEAEYGYDWALEAKEKMKEAIMAGDHAGLIDYQARGRAFQLSIPTPEHYLPLLYVLALAKKDEKIQLFNDTAVGGSIAMTSLRVG